MGFDLVAKSKRAGLDGDFRANIYAMFFLRTAMRQAEIPEKLIQAKFTDNEGQFVTAKQSATIGTKLNEWLTGRSLTVSVVEPDGFWQETIMSLEDAFGGRSAKRRTRKPQPRKRDEGSAIMKITRQHRRFIRDFARYCLKSDGFRVY